MALERAQNIHSHICIFQQDSCYEITCVISFHGMYTHGMCMCRYMKIYVYICMNCVYISVYICTFICIHTQTSIHILVSIHICICTHVCMYM